MSDVDIASPAWLVLPSKLPQNGTNVGAKIARQPSSQHDSSDGSRVVQVKVNGNVIPLLIAPVRPMHDSSNAYLGIVFLIFLALLVASVVAHFLVSNPLPMLVAGLSFLGIAAVALYAKRLSRTPQHEQ